MLRVVDDIERGNKIVPDMFDFFYIDFVSLLTQHGGWHGACVTSYGLHLRETPLL